MQRTTISLSDETARLLKREAHRRHTSIASIAREAIEKELEIFSTEKREVGFAALGSSGLPDIARDIDTALEEAGYPDRDR